MDHLGYNNNVVCIIVDITIIAIEVSEPWVWNVWIRSKQTCLKTYTVRFNKPPTITQLNLYFTFARIKTSRRQVMGNFSSPISISLPSSP